MSWLPSSRSGAGGRRVERDGLYAMTGRTKLYLITGFLGAGKTTLMNRLLDFLSGEKVCVIVNEFGKAGIDASLLPETGMEVRELNNGQVFCSCLSAAFVQALLSLLEKNPDYLLVETSGLARPESLGRILAEIDVLSGGRFDYRGMICVTDPAEFVDYVDLLVPIREQVEKSDVLIINKTDISDEESVRFVEERAALMNPRLRVYRTSRCRVPFGFIDTAREEIGRPAHEGTGRPAPERLRRSTSEGAVRGSVRAVSGAAGGITGGAAAGITDGTTSGMPAPGTSGYSRPMSHTIYPEGIVLRDALLKFMEAISGGTYRMKGFVRTPEGWIHADAVGGDIRVRDFEPSRDDWGVIVIVVKSGLSILENVETAWREIVGAPCTIL